MKLSDIGERGIIERFARGLRLDGSVVRGIGDDAAVIKWKRARHLLFASDMIIEGVHFRRQNTPPALIGRKALAVNISDIAAMGGVPRYAVVSVGLPKDLSLNFTDKIMSGIRSTAKAFRVNLVGGDTNSSTRIVIDVAVIGEVKKEHLALRSGAKAGDIIAVTGSLGGSIKSKHLTFTPRLRESQFLVKNFRINSMIDISDGLSRDLARICMASGTGARIYESLIPLSKSAQSVKNALRDGEDFELLFTLPKEAFMAIIKERSRTRFKTPITAIGEMTAMPGGIKLIDKRGKALPLKRAGFDHFQR